MHGIRSSLSRLGWVFWSSFLIWLGIVVLALLLSGCVSVANEPALDMPARPAITFYEVEGGVCLTLEDANAMIRYILQLNEFQSARERLLKP